MAIKDSFGDFNFSYYRQRYRQEAQCPACGSRVPHGGLCGPCFLQKVEIPVPTLKHVCPFCNLWMLDPNEHSCQEFDIRMRRLKCACGTFLPLPDDDNEEEGDPGIPGRITCIEVRCPHCKTNHAFQVNPLGHYG